MHFLERAWYRKAGWLYLLWPFSMLFQLLTLLRRQIISSNAKAAPARVPVVVIGNISVGGTGKTPLLIELAKKFSAAGFKPGVISRGYLSNAPSYPFSVTPDSRPDEAGDEALLIARSLKCPVVIDPKRNRALATINQDYNCDVIFSDDGLQHYALHRDIEVAVIDGGRLFGNGLCFPAGPLREPVSRLASVDFQVINGAGVDLSTYPHLAKAYAMELEPLYLVNLQSGTKKPFRGAPFNIGATVHAVTGIGNPDRFFNLLTALPYQIERHDFPDHHPFTAQDFERLGIDEHQPIVMTEKDAVKCSEFAHPNFWFLSLRVKLPDEMLEQLLSQLGALVKQKSNASG